MARGDHIYVERFWSLYTHHGIDCGDGTVIHFGVDDYLSNVVQRSSMDAFLAGGIAKVRNYPNEEGSPGAATVPQWSAELVDGLAGRRQDCEDRTADAIVSRAESRLGERGYDLWLNNCEHFAQWCQTGTSRSQQTEAVWDVLASPAAAVLAFA